jgi:hypothetical protein
MYRLCLTSAVLFVLGTASSQAQQATDTVASNAQIESPAATDVASSSTEATPATDPFALAGISEIQVPARRLPQRVATPLPIKTVEIADTGERTVCEDLTLPGSRIVVQKRCYTTNIYDRSEAKLAAQRKESTKLEVEQLRRYQYRMEMQQRERDMARERAVAAMVIQGH